MTPTVIDQCTSALASAAPQSAAAYRSILLGKTVESASDVLGTSDGLWGEIPFEMGQAVQVRVQLSGGILGYPDRSPTFAMEQRRQAVPKTIKSARRERELGWLRTHTDEVRKFIGEWIVLSGEEIIAHSGDPLDAVHQARAKGVKNPLVYKVEGKRSKNVGWLGL